MNGHWFVIANQVTTRLFTERPSRGKLHLVETFNNPLGRERKGSLIRKKAGLGLHSVGHGRAVRHMEAEKTDPHEDAARQLARTIAQYLDKSRKKRGYNTLTVIAEPKFLGKLKAEMNSQTARTVVEWLEADLAKIPVTKLPREIKRRQQ